MYLIIYNVLVVETSNFSTTHKIKYQKCHPKQSPRQAMY